ncbi:MAG: GNAT family N-acetyltransferase [Pseudomonadota bacterium]|nr:GNAT family N-acetyltransferase [Pseudomonadota bacterium]
MTTSTLTIRRLVPGDHAQWLPLWQGYLDFYRTTLAPEITELTWQRLHDALEPMTGFGAVADGRLGGFVIMVSHRSTWARTGYAYLEDLYVAPELRGQGAGRALIAAVYAEADRLSLERVYWVTDTANPARKLYDQMARLGDFVQYRR